MMCANGGKLIQFPGVKVIIIVKSLKSVLQLNRFFSQSYEKFRFLCCAFVMRQVIINHKN